MEYYMIEWDDEEPDEPYRLYVEVDENQRVLRKVEAYRVGFFQRYEHPDDPPIDPLTRAGTGTVVRLLPWQFSDIWNGSPNLPSSFTIVPFE